MTNINNNKNEIFSWVLRRYINCFLTCIDNCDFFVNFSRSVCHSMHKLLYLIISKMNIYSSLTLNAQIYLFPLVKINDKTKVTVLLLGVKIKINKYASQVKVYNKHSRF